MSMTISSKNLKRKFRLFFRAGSLLGLALCLPVLFSSCDQSPIFYAISEEEAPKDPRVTGSPTDIVRLGTIVYAASGGSGKISYYEGDQWGTIAGPKNSSGGALPIRALAGAGSGLYALAGEIYQYVNQAWVKIDLPSTDYRPVSLYGTGDGKIFAGVMAGGGTYHIMAYLNTNGGWKTVQEDTGQLNGVAWDGTLYYAATKTGIFTIDSSFKVTAAPAAAYNTAYNAVGILALGDGRIVAAARENAEGGYLLFKNADSNSFTVTGKINLSFTGAMAVWKNAEDQETLLLLGVQGKRDTSSHGYRELNLTTGWGGSNIQSPGSGEITSVKDRYKYETAVDKYPLQSILQVKPPKGDSQGVIFAATWQNGLWSFRNGSWNAEE